MITNGVRLTLYLVKLRGVEQPWRGEWLVRTKVHYPFSSQKIQKNDFPKKKWSWQFDCGFFREAKLFNQYHDKRFKMRFSLCNAYFYTGKGVVLSLLINTVTEISNFITDHMKYKSKSTSIDVDIANHEHERCHFLQEVFWFSRAAKSSSFLSFRTRFFDSSKNPLKYSFSFKTFISIWSRNLPHLNLLRKCLHIWHQISMQNLLILSLNVGEAI